MLIRSVGHSTVFVHIVNAEYVSVFCFFLFQLFRASKEHHFIINYYVSKSLVIYKKQKTPAPATCLPLPSPFTSAILKINILIVPDCLIRNKSSGALGKKSTPTRIDPFKDDLQELLVRHLEQPPEDIHSIYQLSCHLLPLLKECGYRGSECVA